MKKTFHAALNLTTSEPNVIAEVGAFADMLEQKYGATFESMSVSTNAHGYRDEGPVHIGSYPPRYRAETTQEPAPAPEPKVKKGRVKPETREPEIEVSIPVADLAPETVAELERMAEEAEAAEAAPEPELTAPELTRDDGFSALRALIDSHGNDAAKRALAKLGHVKFSDVPTDRMGDLLEAVAEQAK